MYIVTEMCSGGELFEEIVKRKRLDEKNSAKIIK